MVDRARIAFRPESPDDLQFLFRLYASTRQQEIDVVPWSAEQKETFLRNQFEAQTLHYQKNYEGAEYLIVLLDARPIGRLYLHQNPHDLRIMDIALLPEV